MQLRWLEQTEDQVPEGNDWLTPAEAAHFATLHVPKRRADWRLGRWTAKCAVAVCFEDMCRLAELEIRAAESGAPEVFRKHAAAPFAISISHRNHAACCAVADRTVEVGCDLEWIEPHSQAFIVDYFTRREQHLIMNTPLADKPLLVVLLWSAKESALKALRVGLRADTRSVEVEVPEFSSEPWEHPDSWRPILVRHSAGKYCGWWRYSDRLVRTVVTAPRQPPPVPVPLEGSSIYSEIFRSENL